MRLPPPFCADTDTFGAFDFLFRVDATLFCAVASHLVRILPRLVRLLLPFVRILTHLVRILTHLVRLLLFLVRILTHLLHSSSSPFNTDAPLFNEVKFHPLQNPLDTQKIFQQHFSSF